MKSYNIKYKSNNGKNIIYQVIYDNIFYDHGIIVLHIYIIL